MEFCKQFNARTQNKEMAGLIIPVVITVYADRSFTFITKTPPAAVLLKKAAGIDKGLRHAQQGKGGQGDREAGARDRHAEDARPERRLGRAAIKSIKGTARSMGIEVVA